MPKGVPNKRYAPDFKQMVVEAVHEGHMSYNEAERHYDVPHGRIQKWERIYLTEGPEGLAVERRGRGSKGRPAKFPKEVEEDVHYFNNRRPAAALGYKSSVQYKTELGF